MTFIQEQMWLSIYNHNPRRAMTFQAPVPTPARSGSFRSDSDVQSGCFAKLRPQFVSVHYAPKSTRARAVRVGAFEAAAISGQTQINNWELEFVLMKSIQFFTLTMKFGRFVPCATALGW